MEDKTAEPTTKKSRHSDQQSDFTEESSTAMLSVKGMTTVNAHTYLYGCVNDWVQYIF